MKRPEGFDKQSPPSAESPSARKRTRSKASTPPAPPAVSVSPGTSAQPNAPAAKLAARQSGVTAPAKAGPAADRSAADRSAADRSASSAAPNEFGKNNAKRANLKRAEKARRAYERAESRRFTRRTHRRRLTWLVSALSLLLVAGFVTGAVYSPLLSLRNIRVEGASLVSAASVHDVVGAQLGRPLALLDFDSIARSLGTFPLIRSFVTETVPPDTLIIRIAERAPIASLATASGFVVVDPAGIEIRSGAERQAGLPLIELGAASKSSPAFIAAVGVLLALPADLLKRVDTVTAQTSDDVTLTLIGGQSVIWGSPEQSILKAKVLAAVIKVGGTTTKYDVSAPNHPVLGGN